MVATSMQGREIEIVFLTAAMLLIVHVKMLVV